jgi:hypothetical protein
MDPTNGRAIDPAQLDQLAMNFFGSRCPLFRDR